MCSFLSEFFLHTLSVEPFSFGTTLIHLYQEHLCYDTNIYLIGHQLWNLKIQRKDLKFNKYLYQILDEAPSLLVLQNLSAESPTSPGKL